MNRLILLIMLSGWNYEGFCDDPATAAAAAVEVVPETPPKPPSAPVVEPAHPPAAPRPRPPAAVVVNAVVAEVLKPAPKPRAHAPAPPIRWRLADVAGQVWEHADPHWLRRWVEIRNASLRTARVPVRRPSVVAYPAATACPGGRCYRQR